MSVKADQLFFIKGFSALLAFQLGGEITTHTLGTSLPGPVFGLAYFFAYLFWFRHKEAQPSPIEKVSDHLLIHLSLLFIPASVGIITMYTKISSQWLPIIVALIIGSLVTLLVTAIFMVLFLKLMNKVAPS